MYGFFFISNSHRLMVRRFVQVGGAAVSPVLVCIHIYETGETGDTTPMENKNTHALTLRIPPELDSLITDAAFDARQSKSAWIRLALQGCLKQKQQRHEAVLR
jgi:hypothetical protein